MPKTIVWRALFAFGLCGVAGIAPAQEDLLELTTTIAMPAVRGRIDHLSASLADRRLFVAALGNDTIEVLDATGGGRTTISGMSEPQGVVYVPGADRLFVANGGGGVAIVDGKSLEVVKRVGGMDDADNVRYDAVAGKVYVGHGKGALRLLDAASGNAEGDIVLPGHPESFQLALTDDRIFVNVPSVHAVVVVDRNTRKIVARWDTGDASANYPMALDEKRRRLFVGTRSPAALLVYDIDAGRRVARVPISGDADDIFFDEQRQRLYAICGEGKIDIVRQETPDRYAVEGAIATAPRARTGLFVPEQDTLYVAAPASGPSPARILVYRVH